MKDYDPLRKFRRSMKPVADNWLVDPHELVNDVESALKVKVPPLLMEFWKELGCGYFGDMEVLFLGDGDQARDSLVGWNQHDFWAKVILSEQIIRAHLFSAHDAVASGNDTAVGERALLGDGVRVGLPAGGQKLGEDVFTARIGFC